MQRAITDKVKTWQSCYVVSHALLKEVGTESNQDSEYDWIEHEEKVKRWCGYLHEQA